MRFHELLTEARHFDPGATYLHGGPQEIEGRKLKRYGKSGGDYGALFFCKDTPEGRWYTSTYAGSKGRVWKVKVNMPVDAMFDITNARHRAKLQAGVSREEYANFIATAGSSGHLDWSLVNDELFEELGFRGMVFQERPKGMETGLPKESGMAVLKQPVLSIAVFSGDDVEITGHLSPVEMHDYYQRSTSPQPAKSKLPVSNNASNQDDSSLNESFDNPLDYGWFTRDRASWMAKFSVGRLQYAVEFEREKGNVWTIAFRQRTAPEGVNPNTFNGYGLTGAKNASVVLSTVFACIEDFSSSVNPRVIQFAAKEPSRIRLYKTLVARLVKGSDYKVGVDDKDVAVDPRGSIFTLTRTRTSTVGR